MIDRLRRAAALLHPRALAARARAHAHLPALVKQVEALSKLPGRATTSS